MSWKRSGAADPFNGKDPAPDVYSVAELSPGVLHVKHYPNPDAETACCNVSVRISDDDRARGRAVDDPSGRISALARAHIAIDQRHAGQATPPAGQSHVVGAGKDGGR